jgi:hypothetical protein
MKNIRQDANDSLRPEYRRSDFGEMTRGKYAGAQIEFAELVYLLLTCISEDEGVRFINPSSHNQSVKLHPGDWTYEIGEANQVTLRYQINEGADVEEKVASFSPVATSQDRTELQKLLQVHVSNLKAKVDAL